jgi:hypothetical protein
VKREDFKTFKWELFANIKTIRTFIDDRCLYRDLCDETSFVRANAGVRLSVCIGPISSFFVNGGL